MINAANETIQPPGRPYSSTQGVARVVIAALAILVLGDLIAVLSDIAEIRMLDRAIAGELVTESEFDRNDTRQGMIGIIQTVLLVATAVIYLVWQYRSYANLPALHAHDLDSTPRWSVIAWFIPILNTWRPYQITAEMARASDPRYLDDDGLTWQAAPAPRVLGFWWAAWLLNSGVGRIATRLVFDEAESFEEVRTESFVWLVSDGVDAISALMAMMLIVRITQWQRFKHHRLELRDRLGGAS